MAVDYDPTLPAVMADPYPVLHRLQDEEPVHWNASLKGWVLTRYDHVRDGLRDPRLSAERIQAFVRQLPAEARAEIQDLARALSLWTVFLDPPEHNRLRRLLAPWFSAGALQRMRPRIQDIVDGLIDRVTDHGEMELIGDLAYPLPATVIAEVLGIPPGDRDQFKAWSDELAVFVGRSLTLPGRLDRAQTALIALDNYFRDIIAERRAKPRDDIMSRLIAAEERGDILSDDELVANCILLLFAGHETTTNLIGNGLLSLLRDPDQLRLLRDEPELIGSAVEEFLRYDGPVAVAARVVREDFEIDGQRLKRGDRVYLMVDAANRDPRQFDDPDRLDIRRPHNPHLAFGYGIHLCLGAPLARIEGQIAIATVLRRLPRLELGRAGPEWRDSLMLRGLSSLPLSFGRSSQVEAVGS